MRMVNDLLVRGGVTEVDKLVGRIEENEVNRRWRREPTVEKDPRHSGIGRLGVFCYSSQGGPAAS